MEVFISFLLIASSVADPLQCGQAEELVVGVVVVVQGWLRQYPWPRFQESIADVASFSDMQRLAATIACLRIDCG